MEIKQFFTEPLEDLMIDAVINPDAYENYSFHPSPTFSYLRKELERENVELTKEEIQKRCKRRLFYDGKQEFILDGDKVILKIDFKSVVREGVEIEGLLSPVFITPFSV